MIESVKATHPNTPLTLYANGSGGLLERLGATGADVVGLDWTTDMADARRRLGSKSVQVGGDWECCFTDDACLRFRVWGSVVVVCHRGRFGGS
jgi:uroporphyrinogen decarboxylase